MYTKVCIGFSDELMVAFCACLFFLFCFRVIPFKVKVKTIEKEEGIEGDDYRERRIKRAIERGRGIERDEERESERESERERERWIDKESDRERDKEKEEREGKDEEWRGIERKKAKRQREREKQREWEKQRERESLCGCVVLWHICRLTN